MFNVKNYGYKNVLNNYDSSVPKLTNFADALANSSRTYLPIDTKRSTLDRVFDALSIGTFLSAGVARGLIPNNDVSVSQGIEDALRAANPFGEGYEKGEHTYSKVLGDIGWNPTSFGGKFARGAVGLAGDIFLDPLTYATFGVSGLIKGSGKAATAASHAVGLLGEALEHGDDIAKATGEVAEVVSKGMSTDLAKSIISKHNAARGITTTAEELENGAESFARHYNKIAGIRSASGVDDALTVSLGNAPLGKKLFGKASEKSIKLAESETIQKIGDNTFAPAYAKLRESFYGSKFGKLFNTKSTLYNLSKSDPTAVYDYLKSVDGIRTLNKNVRDAEKAIREVGEQIGLSPDESKSVIEIMEDNSVWNPVKKALSEPDIDKYKEYVSAITEKRNNDSALLEELKSQKDVLDKLAFAKDEEIEGLSTVRKSLDAQYLEKLQKLDAKRVAKKDELINLVHSYDEPFGSAEAINLQELEKTVASFDDELDALDKSDEVLLGKKQKLADMYNSKRKAVTSEAKIAQNAETSKILSTLDEYLTESKSRYEARKAGIKVETLETVDKVTVVRAVSKYILGDEKAISPVIWDKKLEQLQKLIATGASKEAISEYVIKHSDDYLTSSKQTMYSYIANKIGYKDWDSYYHQRIKKLIDSFGDSGAWSEEEHNLYFSLRKAEKARTAMINDFNNYILKYGLDDGISKYITEAANKEMLGDDFLNSGMINTTANGGFKNTLDVQKGSWTDNDFADGRNIVHKSKQADEIVKRTEQTDEFSDKLLYGKALTAGKDKDNVKIVQDLTEKMFFSKEGFIPEKLNKSHFRWVEKVQDEIPKLLEGFFKAEYSDLSPKQTELLYNMAIQNATKNMDSGFKYDKLGTAVAEESRKRVTEFRNEAIKLKTQKGTKVEFMSGGKTQTGVVESFKDATNGRVYKIVGEDGTVFDSVRMNQLTKFESDVRKLNIDEVIVSSDSSKDFFERQHKLYTKVNDALKGNAAKREELLKLKEGISTSIQKQADEFAFAKSKAESKYNNFVSKPLEKTRAFKTLSQNYQSALDNLGENIRQLEIDKQSLIESFARGNFDEIDRLSANIKSYEDMLNNQEALETYIKTMSDLKKPIENFTEEPTVASIILQKYPNASQQVIDVVQKLRADFNKAGIEEVGIGELSKEQFEGMMNHYFPHILTDEGKKLFNLDKEAAVAYDKSYGGVMGKPFNEFGEARNMRVPDGHGGYITNPTVKQVNQYYKDNFDHILKGKNVLSENLSDVYVARMAKHSELMYNTEYINEAVKGFSRVYDGEIPKGYNAVMDFTTFREHSKSYASIATSQEVSRMISQHLSENVNFAELERTASIAAYRVAGAQQMDRKGLQLLTKKLYSQKISEVIQDFIKTDITPEVREAIYKQNLDGFFESTETRGFVDKLSYPLLEFNNAQIDKVKTYTDSIVNSYYVDVTNNIAKFVNQNNKTLNRSVVDYISSHLDTPDDIRRSLRVLSRNVDSVDAERVQRWVGKLDKVESLKFGEFNNVQDTIVAKFNQSRKNQLIKDQSDMLTLYDKMTHLIKLNQTSVLPSFHARNKMANTFNNWLAVGSDATNATFQKTALRAIRSEGNIDDVLEFVQKDGSKASITWRELYNKAVEYGVTGEGFYAKDIDQVNGANSLLFKKLPAQFNPTNAKDFVLYSKGAKFGSMIENQDRLIHFAAQIKNGMGFEEAAESVEKFLFDYSDLTAFEQNVMKRILPYYTWMRKNAPLQLEMLMENPKAYKYVGQVEHGVEGMVNDEDKVNPAFMDDFALDWIQLPFTATNPEGREERVLLNPNLPYGDLSKIPNPLHPIESAKDLFTQTNPLLKVPVEQSINKNVYFDSPIVKEKDDGATATAKRAEHILSQLSLYNTGKDFAEKRGVDLALQGLNTATGIKALSYDYDKYKAIKIQEMLKNGKQSNPVEDFMKEAGTAVVAGFKEAFSTARSQTSESLNSLADSANNDKPLGPDEYTNSLRPISQTKYDALSTEDKEKYLPPTNEQAMAYNKQAVELQQKEMQETGIAKRFTWALFDAFNLGKRNKPYEFGEITEVTDGDTFKVKLGSNEQTVRLLLVDTPETVDPRVAKTMPYGKEASNFSKEYLLGKDTKIYFDGQKTDKYGRLLGYVEVDGVDYNNKILEEGFGQVRYAFNPPYQNYDKYIATEANAAKNKTGLWSLDGYAQPGVDDGYNTNYLESIKRNVKK